MSETKLPACPFCGEKPFRIKDTDFCKCVNRPCPISHLLVPIAAWNRRYVCSDKNGKPVFAGDEMKVTASDSPGSFSGKAQILPCVPVDGVPMPLEYLRCGADNRGIEVSIELIESESE